MAKNQSFVTAGFTSPAAGVTTYAPFFGLGQGTNTGITVYRQTISAPGSINALYFNATTAPGTGETVSCTLMLNGVATALTATLSGTALTVTDLTNSVAVVAGDVVQWRFVTSNNGAYAGANLMMAAAFTPTNANETNLCGGHTAAGTASAEYFALMGNGASNATETNRAQRIPTPGKLKGFYVDLSAAPGVAKTRTITVYVNGAPVAMTVVITGAATTGNYTATEITVAEGDTVSVNQTPTLVPAASAIGFGVTFVPDTPGEFILMRHGTDEPSTSVTNYIHSNGGRATGEYSTTGTGSTIIPGSFDLKKVSCAVGQAPGVGKSWAIQAYKNSTTLVGPIATIADANTSASGSSVHGFLPGDTVKMSITPSGTPASTNGLSNISTVWQLTPDGFRNLPLMGVG